MAFQRVHLFHNIHAMSKHAPPIYSLHHENATRIIAIEEMLEASKFKTACESHYITTPYPRELFVKTYGDNEIKRWETAVTKASKRPIVDTWCPDVYWSAESLESVGIAAQCAVSAVQTALDADAVEHAFALVRPPGHHCFEMPQGFCIANNVALAAQYALNQNKKVAILDWDYHFGDGTAMTFVNNPNLMFCSLHCKTDKTGNPTYPSHSLKDHKLARLTQGRMFNIMWESDDANNAAYAYAFETAILPAFAQFKPDIILVSAGYDALLGDDLAGMKLLPKIFYELTLSLKNIGKPVVCVLEGGYNPSLLSEGVRYTIQGLLDSRKSMLPLIAPAILPTHKKVVDDVCKYLKLGK